ncbi:TIGR00266 family protein [Nitzschia inconspicua]|uniref:TIGR00266 family protein n=1 Tax=Nitzschia inconspicua TaxID=303405 RepID=A0A9K3L175_9STRA|nr:TIGR00266 family protein [Nitzschia inconspicua]
MIRPSLLRSYVAMVSKTIPPRTRFGSTTTAATTIAKFLARSTPSSSAAMSIGGYETVLSPMNHPVIRSFSDHAPAKTSKDGVVGHPIDFDVCSKIEGNESQIVTIQLEPGQVLRAESGAMMYMTNGVQMNTTTGGGLSEGFRRMMTGQNFFISDYTYEGDPGTTGTVALGTDFPSKIIRLNVDEYGGKLVCQKGALLCCSHTINIEMEFTRTMTGGFFGGEGFILQALTGEGDVFLKAGGTLIRRDLEPGEELRISSGCLVAFSHGVDYDVQMIKGFQNIIGSGEGLFMTTLTGPGVVWLSGMPPERLIAEISRRVPSGGGLAFGVPIGVGGGGSGGGEGGDTGGQQQS